MDLLSAVTAQGKNLESSLAAVLQHFGAQIGTIHVLEADGLLHMRAHTKGIPEPVLAASRVIPIGKGIAGLSVERKAPVNLCNLQTDQSGDARPAAKTTGAGGALCVPMLVDEKAVGALGIATMTERDFTDEETALLLEVGRVLARVIDAA